MGRTRRDPSEGPTGQVVNKLWWLWAGLGWFGEKWWILLLELWKIPPPRAVGTWGPSKAPLTPHSSRPFNHGLITIYSSMLHNETLSLKECALIENEKWKTPREIWFLGLTSPKSAFPWGGWRVGRTRGFGVTPGWDLVGVTHSPSDPQHFWGIPLLFCANNCK